MGYNVTLEREVDKDTDYQKEYDYLKENYKFLFGKKPMEGLTFELCSVEDVHPTFEEYYEKILKDGVKVHKTYIK